jgi:phage terminase small subunit
MKLTEKQKRFCEEYLIDLNATQAAVRAGYKNSDVGRRLVTKSHVLNYISELQKEQSKRTGISADTVLKELQKVAFAETDISGKEKIKALELLGKHLGLFSEQCKPSGEQELPALWKALEEGEKP